MTALQIGPISSKAGATGEGWALAAEAGGKASAVRRTPLMQRLRVRLPQRLRRATSAQSRTDPLVHWTVAARAGPLQLHGSLGGLASMRNDCGSR